MPNVLAKAIALGKEYLQSKSVDHSIVHNSTNLLAVKKADGIVCPTCDRPSSDSSGRGSTGPTPNTTSKISTSGTTFAAPEDETAFNDLDTNVYDKTLTYSVAKLPWDLIE